MRVVFFVKTNKFLVVLVIIFFLTTLAGASYICYDNFFKVNNKTKDNTSVEENSTEEKNNKEEKLEVNSRLVQSLYNKVVLDGESYHKYFVYENNDNYIVNEASEMSKLTLAYQNLKKDEFGNVNISNLPPTMVIPGYTYSSYTLPYHTLCKGDVSGLGDNYVSFFSYDDLMESYRDLFGNKAHVDKSIPIRTDPYNVKYYVYNESLDGYVPYITEGGGTSGSYFSGEVTKAVKLNNQIIIYEKVTETPLGSGVEVSDPATYVYTFNIEDDGMYSFVSRIKE